jgi:hypothetical protein
VYWQALLGDDLGAGYRVVAPRMPRPRAPSYWAWARRIADLMARAPKPLVVGHSFGASVILKYLSETVHRPALGGVFLVATPFWGPDFAAFALAPDFGARLSDLRHVYFYHSRHDPEIPIGHLRRYARAMPHATVRILPGREHEFDQPTFPELTGDIRRVRS